MKIQPMRKAQKIRGLGTTRQKIRIEPQPRTTQIPEPTPQEKLLARGIIATDLEAMVFLWLEAQGWREGIDFSFQSSLFGGRQEAGGQVADFILYTGRAHPLVIRVMGEYFHEGPEQQGKDQAARTILEAAGFDVVDVRGEHLRDSVARTMELAVEGIELK